MSLRFVRGSCVSVRRNNSSTGATGSGLGGSDVFGPAVKGGSVAVVEPLYPGYVVISPTGCTQYNELSQRLEQLISMKGLRK